MKITNLTGNNLKDITTDIQHDVSLGIGGLSGSGKTTFCHVVANESLKRIVYLLPKSEYRFLFGDIIRSNYSATKISDLPLVFFLKKQGFSYYPRSTLGTHTNIFNEIRDKFATIHNKTKDFFSFNTSISWCENCKGRGSTAGHTCKYCNGNRYDKKIEDFKIELKNKKYTIIDINNMSVEFIYSIANDLNLSEPIKNILKNLINLKVGYLSLDRIMSTLSGGETTRVLLSEFMAQCENSLIIVDEISIGLDTKTLKNILQELTALGNNNQIWLIDHSDIVLNATKADLFFGPKSGKDGGKIVETSPRHKPIFRDVNDVPPNEYYEFKNLKKRNVDISNLLIPKNRITAVTGESGCGKSTLINDCIVPYFIDKYKKVECVLIGQDRNQSITSRSIVATFLNIKKNIDKLKLNLNSELIDVIDNAKKDKVVYTKLEMLVKLGLGYLSLNRKVQTLSTGEFQCLHLVSKLTEKDDNEMVLIFDEPSKGLSQNILNLLVETFSNILNDSKKSILIIEHNPYMLQNSDFVIDFEKRKDVVKDLKLINSKEWFKNIEEKPYKITLNSKIDISKGEIKHVKNNIDDLFNQYEHCFKGGILKNFSSTANWIYGDYKTDILKPLIALDLEKVLYSKGSFLYEVCSLINHIVGLTKTHDFYDFDFFLKENQCSCCKAIGKIDITDINIAIKNSSKGLWEGLLKEEIMQALKKYNYSKIKFLFKEILKETKIDLAKPYDSMDEHEKAIFLHGYWAKTFFDSSKGSQRQWYGLIHLINKYMRPVKSALKEDLIASKKTITCPICNGAILRHDKKLMIDGSVDIRDVINMQLKDILKFLPKNKIISELIEVVGGDAKLNCDVSELDIKKQVLLKIKDIKFNSFLGFDIILKNTNPFLDFIRSDIVEISKKNKVILLDYGEIKETKQELLNLYFEKGKITKTSYVYEILGFKDISTKINSIRKSKPCQYCGGSKVLKEESIFEGVDVTQRPCLACKETGISDDGLNEKIENYTVHTWINGTFKDLKKDIDINISDIKPILKINELNKEEIFNLKTYLKGK
ncbi:ATP-binding cassette domain-containing protein [Campylobacter devanensis]|uniref:ATP-binding cassette domain-containing protein n=1 Tax=Campylobacter devanensis TaxID=3161138 RepID=UPI000A332B54|nr:ATP-binding cassette domain-containing protein [Campylobacter sp. P0021]